MSLTLKAPAIWPFSGPAIPGQFTSSGQVYVPNDSGLVHVNKADVPILLSLGFYLYGQSARPAVVSISSTSYTLTQEDDGVTLVFTSVADIALTVPLGLGKGFSCLIVQASSGQVTPTGASGVSVGNRQSFTKTAGQYAVMSLLAILDNSFVLFGDGE